MYKIRKYFEKGQPHACDNRMHETARRCPALDEGFYCQIVNERLKICELTF